MYRYATHIQIQVLASHLNELTAYSPEAVQGQFVGLLRRYWEYLLSVGAFRACVDELIEKYPLLAQVSNFEAQETISRFGFGLGQKSLEENAAVGIGIIRHVLNDDQFRMDFVGETRKQNRFEQFSRHCANPIFQYINDRITVGLVVDEILLRYKLRSENYENDALYELSQTNEDRFAKRLYLYLFDSGIDLKIEPKVAAGRPDFVPALQSVDSQWAGEIKLYKGDELTKGEILKNISQIRDYLRSGNVITGYLVIFNLAASDRELIIVGSQDNPILPTFTVGSKTLKIIIIDIRDPAGKTASRGRRKSVEIDVNAIS